METGDLDGAARALEKALADVPADPLAKSWLAQVNLMRRVSSYDPMTVSREAAAHPEDVAAQLRAADFEMAGGDAEKAFDRILAVVKRTSGAERNTARAAPARPLRGPLARRRAAQEGQDPADPAVVLRGMTPRPAVHPAGLIAEVAIVPGRPRAQGSS